MTRLLNAGDPAPDTTEETIDHEAIAARWVAENAPPSPAPQSPPPPGRHRPLQSYEVEGLLGRPHWHGFSTPEPVAEAWDEVERRVKALRATTAGVRSLASDETREGQRVEAAIEAAVEAGEPIPDVPVTDWDGEKVRREAADRIARRRVGEARREYDAVVAAELPAWRARIAGEVERLREVAREALAAAEGPVAEFAEFAGALRAMTPERQVEPEEFLPAARAEADPRWGEAGEAWAMRRAVELMREAEEAQRVERGRVSRAYDALETLRAALR